MLPTLIDQVFQLVNSSKWTEDQASAARASQKKVTQHAEEDPDEQKKFLVSPMVRQCLMFVLTLWIGCYQELSPRDIALHRELADRAAQTTKQRYYRTLPGRQTFRSKPRWSAVRLCRGLRIRLEQKGISCPAQRVLRKTEDTWQSAALQWSVLPQVDRWSISAVG